MDITVIPDDEIKTHRKVALLKYVLKYIDEKDINIYINNIAWLLKIEFKKKPFLENKIRSIAWQ